MNSYTGQKGLSLLERLAIIVGIILSAAGIGMAAWQLSEIRRQSSIQTEAVQQSQQIASADLVLKLRARLDDTKFASLVGDIQNHDHTYLLVYRSNGGKGGKYSDLLVEQYMTVFEDIGYLVEDNLIIRRMAFDEFSYDVEKTWCNGDVQRIIADDRKADKSAMRQYNPIYGKFEKLAHSYLAMEGETCKDLDNQ